MADACKRVPMRILCYCLMPNHFHVVIWPLNDGDMSRWMQWLLTSHVRRYHRNYGTSGRIWQGRFKAFPIQQDDHLLTVMRYVERNPVRASLVSRAIDWEWSSIVIREADQENTILSEAPITLPKNWQGWVDQAITPAELDALRRCGRRQVPYGSADWRESAAKNLGLLR